MSSVFDKGPEDFEKLLPIIAFRYNLQSDECRNDDNEKQY